MSMSATFHQRDQQFVSRAIVIVTSALSALLPGLVMAHLFSHTGEMGFFEEWQSDAGVWTPSRCKCLQYRFAACWRVVWYVLLLLLAAGLIVFMLGVTLMFDQNPYYYCQGETTLAWVLDFSIGYLTSIFIVEPLKILLIVVLQSCSAVQPHSINGFPGSASGIYRRLD